VSGIDVSIYSSEKEPFASPFEDPTGAVLSEF
jgi:hypothetical protein